MEFDHQIGVEKATPHYIASPQSFPAHNSEPQTLTNIVCILDSQNT